jgi:hypothetical protein
MTLNDTTIIANIYLSPRVIDRQTLAIEIHDTFRLKGLTTEIIENNVEKYCTFPPQVH